MSSARLAARIEGVRVRALGLLEHHELVFDKPGRDGTAKANARPNAGQSVHGVIWVLPPAAFEVLDDFEAGYARTNLEVVTTTGRRLVASTYLYSGESFPGAAADAYLRHLIEGALEHGLPRQLVERLEALSTPAGSASSEA